MRSVEYREKILEKAVESWDGTDGKPYQIPREWIEKLKEGEDIIPQEWAEKLGMEPERMIRLSQQEAEKGEMEEDLIASIAKALKDPRIRLINIVGMDEEYLIAKVLDEAFSRVGGVRPNILTLKEFQYPTYVERGESGELFQLSSRARASVVSQLDDLPSVLASLATRAGNTIPVVFLSADASDVLPASREGKIPKDRYHSFLAGPKGKIVLVSKDPVDTSSFTSEIEVIDAEGYDRSEDLYGLMVGALLDFAREKGILMESAGPEGPSVRVPFVSIDREGNVNIVPGSGPGGWGQKLRTLSEQLSTLGSNAKALYHFEDALEGAYIGRPITVNEVDFEGAIDLSALTEYMSAYHRKKLNEILSRGDEESSTLEFYSYADLERQGKVMDPDQYYTTPGSDADKMKKALLELRTTLGEGIDVQQMRRDELLRRFPNIPLEMLELSVQSFPSQELGHFNILKGPPGMGKTQAAYMAVSAMQGLYTLVVVHLDTILDRWVGSSERRLRQALRPLADLRNCIVLMDEFDSLFGGGGHGTGRDEVQQSLAKAFQSWLDTNSSKLRGNGVYIIATTNFLERVPQPLKRSERASIWSFDALPLGEVSKVLRQMYRNMTGQDLKHIIENYPQIAEEFGGDAPRDDIGEDLVYGPGGSFDNLVKEATETWVSKVGGRRQLYVVLSDIAQVIKNYHMLAKTSPYGFGPRTLYEAFEKTTPTAAVGESVVASPESRTSGTDVSVV